MHTQSTVLGIVQQDPGATSASGFTSGKKITKKSLPTELGLPLVAWIEGLKRHDSTDDSPYWLFVDRQKLLSVRRGPDIVFDMELTREGLEIEVLGADASSLLGEFNSSLHIDDRSALGSGHCCCPENQNTRDLQRQPKAKFLLQLWSVSVRVNLPLLTIA